MPAEHILEIRNIVVQYDKQHTVLHDVSLDVNRGERVAVLGRSGTGKTTLFRAINGFAPVTSGAIYLNGVHVTGASGKHLRELRSRIAVVSQRHDLVDRLAVFQNVMAGALGRWSIWRAIRFLIHPSSDEIAEASAALQRVGLQQKINKRTSDLSGGEHQRVAIARALVQRPLLLLADEPVASLDEELAVQILELLCGLATAANLTLICSLHQPHLAERFFSRIIEMRDGRIADDREPKPTPAQGALLGSGI